MSISKNAWMIAAADRVVAAAGAKRGDRALVVAVRIAERVLRGSDGWWIFGLAV